MTFFVKVVEVLLGRGKTKIETKTNTNRTVPCLQRGNHGPGVCYYIDHRKLREFSRPLCVFFWRKLYTTDHTNGCWVEVIF